MNRPRHKLFAFPALAFPLLLIAACGQSAATNPSAHATVTHTPSSSLPLTWHAVTYPGDGVVSYPEGVVTVAPGDGDIAYMCMANGSSRVAVWVTRDRAAHWTHVGDISVSMGTNQCYPTVDGLQPNTAVVAVVAAKLGASPPVSLYTSYVTFDGGSAWRQLSKQQPYLAFQFSTLAGVIYGYLRVVHGQQDEEVPELVVSNDQMRTWRPILQGIGDFSGFDSNDFWLNPVNGALLVKDASVFWSSADAGVHWAKIAVPYLAMPSAETVVQAPVTDTPWHLCVANDDDLNLKNPLPNTLACSIDGGQTWQSAPALNLSFTNVKGTFVSPTDVFALADDGAILATSNSPNDPATEWEYRLAPGAQSWQSLGPAPGSSAAIRYYPGPGDGVLWAWTNQDLRAASYP